MGEANHVRRRFRHIAWVCVALMLFSAASLAFHTHANSIESAKCTVCATAHSACTSPVAQLEQGEFTAVPVVLRESAVFGPQPTTLAQAVRPPPSL